MPAFASKKLSDPLMPDFPALVASDLMYAAKADGSAYGKITGQQLADSLVDLMDITMEPGGTDGQIQYNASGAFGGMGLSDGVKVSFGNAASLSPTWFPPAGEAALDAVTYLSHSFTGPPASALPRTDSMPLFVNSEITLAANAVGAQDYQAIVAKVASKGDKNYTAVTGNWAEAWHEGSGSVSYMPAFFGEANNYGSGNVGSLLGGDFASYLLSTGGATRLYGISASAVNYGSATVTNAYGVYAFSGSYGLGGITNSHGVYVDAPGAGADGIANLYGVYIRDHSTTPVTGVKYNIYSLGANSTNYFQGTVLVGTKVTTPLIDTASGDLQITPAGGDVYFGSGGTRIDAATDRFYINAFSPASSSTHYYDASNNLFRGNGVTEFYGKVGINQVVAPTACLDVTGTTEQLRLKYDASNYVSHTVGSIGGYSIAAVGNISIAPAIAGGGALMLGGYNGWVYLGASNVFGHTMFIGNADIKVRSTTEFGFSSDDTSYGTKDAYWKRGGAAGSIRQHRDGSNYLDTTVSSAGDVTFATTGDNVTIQLAAGSSGTGFKVDFNESQSGGSKCFEVIAGTGAAPQQMQLKLQDKIGYTGGIVVNQANVNNYVGILGHAGTGLASFTVDKTGLPERLKLGGAVQGYAGYNTEHVTLLATSRLLTLCQNGDTNYADLVVRYFKAVGSTSQNDTAIRLNASDNAGFSDKGAGYNTIGVVGGGSVYLAFDGQNASFTAYAATKIGFTSTAGGTGWAAAPDAYWTRNAAGSINQHYDASTYFRTSVASNAQTILNTSGSFGTRIVVNNPQGGSISINRNDTESYSYVTFGYNAGVIAGYWTIAGGQFGFSNSNTNSHDWGNVDTSLGRNAAGVAEINNGTAGTFRDLKLRNLSSISSVYANHQIDINGAQISFQNALGPGYSLYISGDNTGSGGGATIRVGSNGVYEWTNAQAHNGSVDTSFARSVANGLIFSGNSYPAAGNATSRNCVNKAVASIADATPTTVFTVTIPNGAHSASIRVRLIGSSGAGGAIGANESTQEAEYLINLTRTAGVNAVAAIGAVIGQPAAATVAGGNAVAVSATLGAISGAVGATNTFTIQVTIARSAGSATNHTCLAFAELLNANASGITIS